MHCHTCSCWTSTAIQSVKHSARTPLVNLRCRAEQCSEAGPKAQPNRRWALVLQGLSVYSGLQHRIAWAGEAQQRLSVDQIKDIIAHDFQSNQYYITGKLTPSIFTEDCVFVDPTTRVSGVQKYSKAVAALFDHDSSRADLISIQVRDEHTITSKWRFAASLNVPGKPKLKPYTGSTTYKLNSEGLIYEHAEDWDISALDAFVSILLPSFGAPAAPPVENPVKA